MNHRAAEFWMAFASDDQMLASVPYQVWYFGNTEEMARDLADLVISGKKIASGSLADVNNLKPAEAPVLGGYSVVTYFDGEPACIIRTVEVSDVPFNQVDARFAADEGEGDLSLAWWRDAHRAYFERETNDLGLHFYEDSLVCCERFVCLYPK